MMLQFLLKYHKLDIFFNEFANLSQRFQNLEQKDFETAGSRISSSRDSVHVARQPVAKSKAQCLLRVLELLDVYRGGWRL